jgi:single-strand DNA-binding protein
MSEEGNAISLAGNLTDHPEVRYTGAGIARAGFRVAVSGRREQEPSFFTVMVCATRPSTPHSPWPRATGWWPWAGSSSGAGPPRTAAPRLTVEVVAEELGPSLRWATATTTRTTRSQVPA